MTNRKTGKTDGEVLISIEVVGDSRCTREACGQGTQGAECKSISAEASGKAQVQLESIYHAQPAARSKTLQATHVRFCHYWHCHGGCISFPLDWHGHPALGCYSISIRLDRVGMSILLTCDAFVHVSTQLQGNATR